MIVLLQPLLLACVTGLGAPDNPVPAGEGEKVQGKALSIERDAESVRVFAREALIARYRYGGAIRKPYLAELAVPGGQNVLLDAPPDHLHHHGIMLACQVGEVNFWSEAENDGREVHVSFAPLRVRDSGEAEVAVLSEKLRWVDAGGRPLLEEERTLKVQAPADAVQVVVWESRLTPPAGSDGATLSGAPYHGLGVRFVRAMDRGGVFFSSTGSKGVEGTNGKEAAWCAYTAEAAPGSAVTAAVLDAPSSSRHPARWFTMTDPFAYISNTQAIGEKPVRLAGGESFILRSAIVLVAGKADPPAIEQLYGKLSAEMYGR